MIPLFLGRRRLRTHQECRIRRLPLEPNQEGNLTGLFAILFAIIEDIYSVLQTEAELLAEKKCVAHLTGEVPILRPSLIILVELKSNV